jgi:hypothetical protein
MAGKRKRETKEVKHDDAKFLRLSSDVPEPVEKKTKLDHAGEPSLRVAA